MKNEKSQLKIGIVLNYINMIIGNLIPIFYTPIMLSLLGQSEYGLYKLSSSVTSYLGLVSLGIGSAVTRYLIKYRVEKGKDGEEYILGLFMRIFRIISVAALIFGIILTFNLDIWYADSLTAAELQRMQIIVFLMTCNTAVTFAVSPITSVVNTHERFVFIQCVSIILTCVTPIINLIVLWLGYASIGMVTSSIVINLIVQIIYVVYVRFSIKVKPLYGKYPKSVLKDILTFSFWIFVANVAGQLGGATDTVMIGAVPALATTGVAVYNIGATFDRIGGSLAVGVSNLLSPRVNKMVFSGENNSSLTDLAIRIGRIQTFIITLIISGFIAFGKPFIHFYVGDGYGEAYWIAILLMVPGMIPLIQSVCLSVIVAENKHAFRSFVSLGIAISNVIGTWFLMKVMGIIGAALMTSITMLIGTGIIMNLYYWKKIKLEIPRFWKEIGKIFIAPVLMCMITLLISKYVDFYNIWILMLGVIIYTLLYAVLSFVFVMNDYEKSLITMVADRFASFRRRKSV